MILPASGELVTFSLIHWVCEETATVSRHRHIVGFTLPPGLAIEARGAVSLSYTGCGQSASVTSPSGARSIDRSVYS